MSALPKRIKHYRILSELSPRSGTLLALDDLARRQVVLKELRAGVLVSAAELDEFRRAVQAVARRPSISAARTIELMQVRSDSATLRYLVREFREGLSLAGALERGDAFSADEASQMLARLARALGAMHDAEIVHGNLSPSNVIADSEGRLQLVDHGLPPSTAHRHYVAPEVLGGQRPSVASDVYSLGAIYRSLLLGKRPARPAEDLSAIAGERSSLLNRMLSLDPQERPGNAWIVAGQLEQIPASKPASHPAARPSAAQLEDNAADEYDSVLRDLGENEQAVRPSGQTARGPAPQPQPVAQKPAAPMAIESVPQRLSETAAPPETGHRGIQRFVAIAQFFFVTWAVGFLLFEISKGALLQVASRNSLSVSSPGAQPVYLAGTTSPSGAKGRSVEAAPTPEPGDEMCLVPAGEATVLDPISSKRERVALGEFRIDKYEVSNAEFLRFTRETGTISEGNWQRYFLPGMERYPVVGVTWRDAEAYARWQCKRLPTAQEWEKAAGGEEGRAFPWGAVFDPSRCASSSLQKPVPVDSFPEGRSPYGVYNMAGNVWEWVSDTVSGQRFVMGGSYNSEAASLGTAAHMSIPAEGFRPPPDIGFRCAR